ncbi:MAG: hypothetical protein KKH98_13695 [Spirochaetes bacterium]|nr:hypothetical protein [Spirochaetota bacterium]
MISSKPKISKEEKQRRKQRRKQYLIERKFQIHFIADFLKVLVAFLLLVGAIFIIFYYFKYEHGNSVFNEYLLEVKKGKQIRVISPFEIISPIIVISVMITVVFTIVYGLFYSHKIAGPIYRFKRSLDTMTQGRLDFHVTLRKKDKFKEIAGFLNDLITTLNTKIKNIKGNTDLLGHEISALQNLTGKQSVNKTQLNRSLQEIKKLTTKIKGTLKDFKTK